jgi:hypothetical protein
MTTSEVSCTIRRTFSDLLLLTVELSRPALGLIDDYDP